jgi:hypothetical protein
MNQSATAAESRYMGLVASMKCLICRRFPELDTKLKSEVHHLAIGSSRQNNWLVAPLCGSKTDGGHHRGGAGLHGMGLKAFIRLYRVPHDTEYGLLAWLNEDMAAALTARRSA